MAHSFPPWNSANDSAGADRFLYEGKQRPKIFLRTLLYATGKRGHVIEGLFLKVQHKKAIQTFAFWAYGERNALTVAGGLRVTEEGVSYNHHFLQINEHWYFPDGEYEIAVYASIVNQETPRLLSRVTVALTGDDATQIYLRQGGALFTWNPDTGKYDLSALPDAGDRAQYGFA